MMTSLEDEQQYYRRLEPLFAEVHKWAEVSDQVPEVQPGSRTADDDELTDPYQLSHAVALSLGSARDHLHALRSLVIDANALHTSAPWTLCRAALENGAQARWLLEPDDRTERVTRRLRMAVRDARERCAATMLLAPDAAAAAECTEHLQDRLTRFGGLGEAAGIPRRRVTGDKAPGWGALVRQAAAPTGLEPDALNALWRIASGYAHGQVWATLATASMEQQLRGRAEESVSVYRVTADVSMVFTIVSSAFMVIKDARFRHDMARLRFRPVRCE